MLKDKKIGREDTEMDFPYLRLIPCQVEPGMFRGEYLVYVQGIDQSDKKGSIEVQLFVDENAVKCLNGIPQHNKRATGWLRVALANVEQGMARVVLPQPAVPVGESMIVKETDLREAAIS